MFNCKRTKVENVLFNKYLKILYTNDSVTRLRFAHRVNPRQEQRDYPPSLSLSLVVFPNRFSSSTSSLDFTEDSEDRQEPYQETHTRIPKAALLPLSPLVPPISSRPHLTSFYFFFFSSASRHLSPATRILLSLRVSSHSSRTGATTLDKRNAASIAVALRRN